MLQSLPTEGDILKLQEARRLDTERRIQQERRHQMALTQQRARQKNDESPKVEGRRKQQDVVVKSSGWHPSENVSRATAMDGTDPMVQQMGIIREYIKQARQASKWDEVRMLEENLRHLQQEYWRQTQGPAS